MTGIMHQISVFDMIEKPEPMDDLAKTICKGSSFEGGKIRIYAAAVSMDNKRLAEFLKDEYGTGGCSMPYGFVDYNPQGIVMRFYKPGRGGDRHEKRLTWTKVAEMVKRYIGAGMYLHISELAKVEALRVKHGGSLPLPYPRFHYE